MEDGAAAAGPRNKLLSSMLAAAAERLESSHDAAAARAAFVGGGVKGPLQPRVDSGGVGQHQTHLLPTVQADQQQQQMLAKATSVIER